MTARNVPHSGVGNSLTTPRAVYPLDARDWLSLNHRPMLSTTTESWLECPDGQSLVLRGNCAIGRSSANDLVVRTDKASRRHATIHAQESGAFWLIDLGSANGTSLNNRRVTQPVKLNDGDVISIGGESLVFRQRSVVTGPAETISDQSLATLREIRFERCWLLVADIKQFTQLSQEIDAAELAGIVEAWVRQSREIVESAGGEINKYLGDGYIAFWRDGLGVAAKVSKAIKAMQAFQGQLQFGFRIALHLGKVMFGSAASTGEDGLMGPEVNFVFRMEKLAGELGATILLSPPAHELLRGYLPARPVDGQYELKGFPGTHRFFFVADPQ